MTLPSALRRQLRALHTACARWPVLNPLRLQVELTRTYRGPRLLTPPTGRVLILAPHMDDEVFGCGGTLALAAAAGARTSVVYVTDGSKGYAPERVSGDVAVYERRLVATRKEEAARAGAILSIHERVFLDLPDGALRATPDAIRRLAATLRDHRPDVVCLPFLMDPHPDHRMTNRLFLEAATEAGLDATLPCWGYEVWMPLVANAVVDVTSVIGLKETAMKAFASQIVDCDYPRTTLGLNAHRALLCAQGVGFAEAFHVADLGLYRALWRHAARGAPRVA